MFKILNLGIKYKDEIEENRNMSTIINLDAAASPNSNLIRKGPYYFI